MELNKEKIIGYYFLTFYTSVLMYFISTHKRIVNSVIILINTIILLIKWNSRHIKGSNKKISKSKAINDRAKVKNCKE